MSLHDITISFGILPTFLVLRFDDVWHWKKKSETCYAPTREFITPTLKVKDASGVNNLYKLSSVFCSSSKHDRIQYACFVTNGLNTGNWLEFTSSGLRQVSWTQIASLQPLFLTYVQIIGEESSTEEEHETIQQNLESPILQDQIWEKRQLLPRLESSPNPTEEVQKISLSEFVGIGNGFSHFQRNELVINGNVGVTILF